MGVAACPVAERETALIVRAQSGDDAAFGELVRGYRDRVQRFVGRALSDPTDAEDIAQETFLRAHRGLPHFTGNGSFRTWLFKIASNLTIDTIRRRPPQQPLSLNEPIYGDAEADFTERLPDRSVRDPLDLAVGSYIQDEVRAAIAELPPKLRSTVVLYELEGYSYDEIAEVLDCPQGTVKSRLFNARRALKRKLRRRLPTAA